MKVTLESTTKIVTLVIDGAEVPARVWEGYTSSGIAVHAYLTRIAVHRLDDHREFERELQEQRTPLNPDVAALPRRLVV